MSGSGPVTEAEVSAAIEEASELLGRLVKAGGGDAARALFILNGALQLLHALTDPAGRAEIEVTLRRLLESMYQAPPADKLIAQGGWLNVHLRKPRGGG